MDLKVTPKDSVDALRLMRRHADDLLEPDDDNEAKEQIQGIVATYCALKRAGDTDQEFLDWYENADLSAIANDEADGPDPTE